MGQSQAPKLGQTSYGELPRSPINLGHDHGGGQRTTTYRPALPMDASSLEVFSQLKKVVAWTEPSVVHIEAKKVTTTEDRLLTGGRDSSRTVETEEAGAGIILEHRNKFYVLTNRHVINGAAESNIFVQLHDGTFYYPYQIWEDSKTDLAVLGLNASGLTAAPLGDSNQMTVGDFVVAIGSPFGLNHSVSYGIISATGRRNLDLGKSGVQYQDFIQTDAAINPGNSGGPLINLQGQVIAINTAIASNSGGNDGIGFSIPIRMAHRVATDLIEYGKVRRAFLGVHLDSQYSAKTAASLGLNTVFGARVLRIGPESPAANSGLQVGDVILDFNGSQVRDDSHFVLLVSQAPIDEALPLTVYRSGQRYAISVRLTLHPDE
jgi:serine protease Do